MPLFGPSELAHYVASLASPPALVEQAPASAAPPSKGAGWGPYAALIASNGADIGTSLYGMKHGLHEGNRIFGGDDPGMLIAGKVIPALTGLVVTKMLADSGHPTAAKVAGYLSSVPPSIAALHNYDLIRKTKDQD